MAAFLTCKAANTIFILAIRQDGIAAQLLLIPTLDLAIYHSQSLSETALLMTKTMAIAILLIVKLRIKVTTLQRDIIIYRLITGRPQRNKCKNVFLKKEDASLSRREALFIPRQSISWEGKT